MNNNDLNMHASTAMRHLNSNAQQLHKLNNDMKPSAQQRLISDVHVYAILHGNKNVHFYNAQQPAEWDLQPPMYGAFEYAAHRMAAIDTIETNVKP